MPGSATYISVILPLRLEWEPCYRLPEGTDAGDVHVGDRVKVGFANREYYGVVSATDIVPETSLEKIKPVISLEHDMERIYPDEIDLWRKVAEYYLCSIGEVYKAAYPYGKISLEEARAVSRSRVRARRERLTENIRERIAKLEARLKKKEEMHSKARKESTREKYAGDIGTIKTEIEQANEALNSLNHSAVSEDSGETNRCRLEINLTEAQSKAHEGIVQGFKESRPVMLHGITGAGKTEIYTKLAYDTLGRNQNVLYLVPEIALSRQLEDRLSACFGDRLLVFHSGESAASKRDVAETIRHSSEGKRGYIVLGTRSSVFLPHNNLGLIIVDEEHDNSYKQDSPAPRYNGRDTALMLHRIHGCNIILGSATPSLEEIYNCRTGKHALVELKERYHGSEDADIEIIDTKAERRKKGMSGSFSRKLIEHINKTIIGGGQVIILRSRRAWAPVMQCDSCGEIVKCPHCNVSMSYHKEGKMTCHYCGHNEAYTGKCHKCGGSLMGLGAGTQKIEEEAALLFPEARIARLDSDTTRNKTFETRTIRDFSNGKIDILIGTQIVTKGFDFSNLRLVAVIAADTLLGMQDFRADEKALQILEQFKGRCGRRGEKGLFAIQTSQPDHPVYQRIANGESIDFSDILMSERKDFGFPPFTRIVEIIIRDIYEDRAERMAARLGRELNGYMVTGPYAPVVDKVADQHIRILRISLKKDRHLVSEKTRIRDIVMNLEKTNRYDGHITINVDPS